MARIETLVAQQPHRYGTRRLQAGDEYEAPEKHADLLILMGRAKLKVRPTPAAAAPVAAPVGIARANQLRANAKALGIRVDGRWSIKRLEDAIAAAKAEAA